MKNYKKKNPEYSSLAIGNYAGEPMVPLYQTRRCLYCYGELYEDAHYHVACCKKFFGQPYQPIFAYNKDDMNTLASKIIASHQGVTGVQPKISLSWRKKAEDNRVKKLTIVGLYGDYILKPPSDFYPYLPEIEDCTMHLAQVCGLKVVPHTLFVLADGEKCFLTKRVDRTKNTKLHMEDMCQLSERQTEDKYKGSHEQVAKLIMKYSANPMLDVTNFYEYVIFSFLTGNADMHLKNFSLLESEQDTYMLSPAYDLLNTKLVNPTDMEELALTLNAKKSKLGYADFLAAFNTSKLSPKVLNQTIENFYYCRLEMKDVLYKSFMPMEMKEKYEKLLDQRMKKLTDKDS